LEVSSWFALTLLITDATTAAARVLGSETISLDDITASTVLDLNSFGCCGAILGNEEVGCMPGISESDLQRDDAMMSGYQGR
jgi:hypothetical protein